MNNYSKIHTALVTILSAHIIDVEVDLSSGLHAFDIVGLADKAVDESKDRISAAIKNSGLSSPKQTNQKILISLAPAQLKKEGTQFDVAIALAYLQAAGSITFQTEKKIFLGELSLDGELRPVRGVLACCRAAKEHGFKEIFVPQANAHEASLISGITVYGISHLTDLIAHFDALQHKKTSTLTPTPHVLPQPTIAETEYDFKEVVGQERAKRGLLIAAAGGHCVAMCGAPGTGKTMLARAFCSLLPPLSHEEILEITSIHSVAGAHTPQIITRPPFRAPHHTASYVSLIGGGSTPKPGEVTLAHRGVLFLDEFPEFERRVIDSLRQPLEERTVTVTRAKGTAQFPAHFILIAAMNPCPCGYRGIPHKECVCSLQHITSYKRKISGPIMDRIDLWVNVEAVSHASLSQNAQAEGSEELRGQVVAARARMRARAAAHKNSAQNNASLHNKFLKTISPLSADVSSFFNASAEKLQLSARAYHRVWKVAQTIADLAEHEEITIADIAEALTYRPAFD